MPSRIGGKYDLGRKLGSGSFGDVYLGTDPTSSEKVAIKMEPVQTKGPQLQFESKVYRVLQGGEGVPQCRWFGSDSKHNILVTDLLGSCLETLLTKCGRKFSPLTIMMVGEQLVARLQYMHQKNMLHRDIKPDNFLIGLGNKANIVHVIDFGLSKRYCDTKTQQHIPCREGKSLTGTPRYASINNHRGLELSRRDDMESVGYLLIYLARGSLPWQGIKANSKRDKYKKIMEKKMSVSLASLCKGLPEELHTFLEYCRSLRFQDEPNYAYLLSLFQGALQSRKYGDPKRGPDWLNIERQKSSGSSKSHIGRPRVESRTAARGSRQRK